MGAYKYLEEIWKRKQSAVMSYLNRLRTWEYRQLPVVHRISHPTRVDKARRLGYKAKQGYVVYRARVRRGNRKRPYHHNIAHGKPVHDGIFGLKYQRSQRTIAEDRVGRRCPALRVLNSYWVAQDATYMYFEVICIDPAHNAIRNDPRINWMCKDVMKHRELRGLTAAGKKSRGITKKGRGTIKLRPSRRATWKRLNTTKFWRYR
eukprot:TRINITY_DN1813_c0_g1_i1.p1 TRINITY_DN1813_c0_g1~~TRINITY_DN1813_c0_g1_i1.p1  ORF type:complete len:205 (+),score=24.16 TRINITY_DN1813_c0_g1_i1:35-649(+)